MAYSSDQFVFLLNLSFSAKQFFVDIEPLRTAGNF